MLIHPDVHLEIARQRQADLLADAQRRRVPKGRDARTGRPTARVAEHGEMSRITRHAAVARGLGCDGLQAEADHFGHRRAGGLAVDLFWNPSNLKDEFRVEVKDERDGSRFVLHPTTGREAIRAFYHPLSAVCPRSRVLG